MCLCYIDKLFPQNFSLFYFTTPPAWQPAYLPCLPSSISCFRILSTLTLIQILLKNCANFMPAFLFPFIRTFSLNSYYTYFSCTLKFNFFTSFYSIYFMEIEICAIGFGRLFGLLPRLPGRLNAIISTHFVEYGKKEKALPYFEWVLFEGVI